VWVGDARVARVARIVCDLAGGSASGLRVLDLGCDEGNFAIQLGQLGANEVIGVEGRDKTTQATSRSEALGLSNVRFERGDVRAVTSKTHGAFDVVLCLGILYHFDTPDVFEFAENVAGLTERFAIIETQISLTRKREEHHAGHVYWGKTYAEDVSMTGASLDNPQSFWPTRASLLNLLLRVGFTTVSEVHVPAIPALNAWRDHVVLIATKGGPQAFDAPEPDVWPERLAPQAHPTQGIRWRATERIGRLRARGFTAIFRPPPG
jgi:SAM-dependent methyltransferase